MTTHEERAKTIFGERAAFYASSPCHSDPEVLARVVAAVRPESDDTALDIATGTGNTAFALAPHVRAVAALDLSSPMLREGREIAGQRSIANVAWLEGDVHRLPFRDRQFNIVTSRRAPHHFSDIDAALQEIGRVLANGGRLVVDDRSVPEDDEVDALMNELDTLHDASHVRQYRPSEWRALLESNGFAVERVEPYVIRRPIDSLTENVAADDARRIMHRLDAVDNRVRTLLDLGVKDDTLHLNHWYVTVAAVKR